MSDEIIEIDTVNVDLTVTDTDAELVVEESEIVLETASVGPQGPQGATGATGPSNVLSVGSVTSGGTAAASITGTSPSQVLNLVLPKGDTGATGPKGDTGATGAAGPAGPAGPGVPSGGSNGQILQKLGATDYSAQWVDFSSLDATATNVHVYVKNGSGQALTKGQVVYISGASGANPLITLAKADTEATSSKTLGVLKQDLAINAFGYVIAEGILEGLNTELAQDGDPIWLSGSTAGGMLFGLANKPSAPTHMVFVGYVLRAQSQNGVVYVKPQNGFELQELHNVAISSPSTGQTLNYDSSTGLWSNTTPIVYDALGAAATAQANAIATAAADATSKANTAQANAISAASADATTKANAVQTNLTTHTSATTSVHGITNTANLVYTSDTRLSDARTPTAHASTHTAGGSDAITVNGSQITDGSVGRSKINWQANGSFVPTWSSGTTYGIGDLVTYNTIVYRSVTSGNIGNTPSGGSNTFWQAQTIGGTTQSTNSASSLAAYTSGGGIGAVGIGIGSAPVTIPSTGLTVSNGSVTVSGGNLVASAGTVNVSGANVQAANTTIALTYSSGSGTGSVTFTYSYAGVAPIVGSNITLSGFTSSNGTYLVGFSSPGTVSISNPNSLAFSGTGNGRFVSSTRNLLNIKDYNSNDVFNIDYLGAISAGANGSTQGQLKLNGATSGTTTITTPAVAGTSTITLPTNDLALTTTANTSVTLPTSGTLATTAQIQPRFSPFVSGGYYRCGLVTQTVSPTASTVNTCYYAPFYVGTTTTFNEISCSVSTATATAVVRLGVFNDSGSWSPSTVALDAGTVSCATTGVKAISLSAPSLTLTQGWYWLAACPQGANVTLSQSSGGSPYFHADQRQLSTAGVSVFSYTQTGVTGSFSTASVGTIGSTAVPIVTLKVA